MTVIVDIPIAMVGVGQIVVEVEEMETDMMIEMVMAEAEIITVTIGDESVEVIQEIAREVTYVSYSTAILVMKLSYSFETYNQFVLTKEITMEEPEVEIGKTFKPLVLFNKNHATRSLSKGFQITQTMLR